MSAAPCQFRATVSFGPFTNSPLTATQVIRPSGPNFPAPLRSDFVVVSHSQSQDTMTSKFTFCAFEFCFNQIV